MLSEEIETIKKKKNRNPRVENSKTELKNSIENLNNRLGQARRISVLEDKILEITQSEDQKDKEKRMKKAYRIHGIPSRDSYALLAFQKEKRGRKGQKSYTKK